MTWLWIDFPFSTLPLLVADATTPFYGRLAFAGVFIALVAWLIAIPAARIGHAKGRVPPWKNVRLWAILIASGEALVYLLWK